MRTWFEPLPYVRDKADCRVLNMAVRRSFPTSKQPMHKDLVKFAMAYKRGMSAQDLLDAIEDMEP